MKKTMILLYLLSFSFAMLASDDGEVNGIRVFTKDTAGKDVTYDFLFSSDPKLAYQTVYNEGDVSAREVAISGKDVKGRFGEDEIILSRDRFEKITFVYVDPSTVGKVSSDNVIIRMTGNHEMEVSGLANGETVSVYTTDGKQIASANAYANGNAKVDIPGSETGTVYVVRTGKLSFKVRTK
ncbi:MAG: hypothetical protein K5899_08190 [Bacteroidaceae bacterium]|nr:hypothetical protein [Bacteroidaceae bacterium]